ncbi:hypothetical protein DH2020_023461 [Rehmannia glutinosa]|uniref:APS kinase domain-containing protein n=1 Tax=Rehmannia glutinosa TaxID=99300 RepID=A0ABR0W640_REHGL
MPLAESSPPAPASSPLAEAPTNAPKPRKKKSRKHTTPAPAPEMLGPPAPPSEALGPSAYSISLSPTALNDEAKAKGINTEQHQECRRYGGEQGDERWAFSWCEVAKLFADAGLICIASLISPYRKDRDACRALLPENFIEARLFVLLLSFQIVSILVYRLTGRCNVFIAIFQVFLNMPLELCKGRDPKGLYKLARAGNIKGIDDPYEPPLKCEIEIQERDGNCPTPNEMAGKVVTYLEDKGYLEAQCSVYTAELGQATALMKRSPLAPMILSESLPSGIKTSNLPEYNGTGDPREHLDNSSQSGSLRHDVWLLLQGILQQNLCPGRLKESLAGKPPSNMEELLSRAEKQIRVEEGMDRLCCNSFLLLLHRLWSWSSVLGDKIN